MSQSHSRSSSHVRLHVNADELKQDEGQWQPANAKAAVELPSLSLASHGALLPGTGPDAMPHIPERQLAPSPLWGEHADAKAASATAATAATADQQTLRSRHGRSQPDPAASAAADCFAADFLEQPLLQNRGASSVTAQHLLGTPPPRLHLRWDNITQWVSAPTAADPSARKRILCNVSGRAYSGETLAVMGPSGSGKTSLISLLAGGWRKARAAGNLDGSILINGQPSTKRMKRYIAYVAQDDLLFANLTVEQTLRYSALLNLPRELSYEQKLQRVRSVIELLGLSKCSHTKIGGAFSRGISGGERKRTSVANEMLANPSLIMAVCGDAGHSNAAAA
jgi:ABC-type lipoprotein export system ATPase subunit